ncbi:Rhodopirellula transposase OS=delta proteobacterium NaphS2 GN=NPH_0066 PE=4 SV=1: DDE_Tnp_ISAZ013 [Gemmata massiliana]|nr:Rhodopirellula transposase OS=delta proteobacterium NaphS2 GN=NPH_0066 PE=4 SV=1: DDE_Tnp_ISAZ013 [Gemmata massiliana]
MPAGLHRLWAAAEAATIGRGGAKLVSAATGISPARIAAGMGVLRGRAPHRRASTGRKRGDQFREDRDPTLVPDLEKLLADEVAGDPMTERVWVRTSARKLRDTLQAMGHPIGHCTVHRLLGKLGFTSRANQKRRGGSQQPGRDEQFEHIASQRKRFGASGLPSISVDTKQKVLIGPFARPGKTWCKTPTEVHGYDFTSLAEYRAVPYGIYDLQRNEGHVAVGI